MFALTIFRAWGSIRHTALHRPQLTFYWIHCTSLLCWTLLDSWGASFYFIFLKNKDKYSTQTWYLHLSQNISQSTQLMLTHFKSTPYMPTYILYKPIWVNCRHSMLQSPPSVSVKMSGDRTKSESEKNGAVGNRDRKKERTAWKGGKQFHANKGWTIGELSASPPSLCGSLSFSLSPCVSLSLQARAELFDRDKAGRGLGFFCRLLNALWSIPKRLILFRERFPISLMLFNNSSSFLWFGLSVGRIT